MEIKSWKYLDSNAFHDVMYYNNSNMNIVTYDVLEVNYCCDHRSRIRCRNRMIKHLAE